MYQGDSFHTLSGGGQIAVLCLSLVLLALWMAACRHLARGRKIALRLAIALVLFALFEWLSPQAYYLLYIQIFDLPLQWVAGAPPGPVRLLRLLTFTAEWDLSHHGRGLLGWMLIGAALWTGRGRRA